MIKILVKKFIKNSEDVKDSNVREKYGILGGVLGIICNVILFVIKLTIGLFLNAIAILSDAFNNLTDSFSSVVSIISAKISNKKPDKRHPYGHGRIEYVSTLIVSFIIVLVGIELLFSSIDKLVSGINGNAEALVTGKYLYISLGILAVSLLIKLWMYSYNKYLGKKVNSNVLLATASDSISDVITSASIIVVTLIGSLLLKDNYFYLDAIMGIIVSIIICINGFKIVLSTISDLLGRPVSVETEKEIEDIILKGKGINGVHDLMVHDYGPGRMFASAHAEVDAHGDIMDIHENIDKVEQICFAKTGVTLTIHMDPIDYSSPEVKEANEIISSIINNYKGLSYHDLRITDGKENINVIFDIVIPFDYENDEIQNIIKEIKENAKNKNPKYSLVIKIDRPFIEN